MIEIPRAAVDPAKRFEGFHRVPQSGPLRPTHPYMCLTGFMTVGFGHLCAPDHPPITEAEAEVYLAPDLTTARNATRRDFPALATEP